MNSKSEILRFKIDSKPYPKPLTANLKINKAENC